MDQDRRRSLIAGVLFLLTFATSIPGALLYGPVLSDPHFVLGSGATGAVLAGALCEIALVIANLGTALVLYPVLRRTSPSLALAYVVARVMECTLIAVGILSLLTVVTLRQDGVTGAGDAAAVVVAQALVALHGWTFLLGPGFVVGIGNGLLLGWMLYRAHLRAPRLGAHRDHRRTDPVAVGHRRAPGRLRPGLTVVGARHAAGVRVGGVPRHLPDGARVPEERARGRGGLRRHASAAVKSPIDVTVAPLRGKTFSVSTRWTSGSESQQPSSSTTSR